MEPRIHVITLGVEDLQRALGFYRDGLGFDSADAMFNLQGGLILCVYPRSELAKDAGVPFGPPKSGEFSIGHAVAGRADVDTLLASAKAAGATILDKPHDRPWGIYSGYYQDPDGHLWEIMHNPALQLDTA